VSTNGNGLILNRNGTKPRGPETHNVTREECEAIVKAAVEEQTIRICEFYLAQVPQMVAQMTLEILKAHGIEPQAPPPRDVIPAKPEEIQ
jgi:hypothetical protein